MENNLYTPMISLIISILSLIISSLSICLSYKKYRQEKFKVSVEALFGGYLTLAKLGIEENPFERDVHRLVLNIRLINNSNYNTTILNLKLNGLYKNIIVKGINSYPIKFVKNSDGTLTGYDFIKEHESEKIDMLKFPIKLEPYEIIEGRIVFDIYNVKFAEKLKRAGFQKIKIKITAVQGKKMSKIFVSPKVYEIKQS